MKEGISFSIFHFSMARWSPKCYCLCRLWPLRMAFEIRNNEEGLQFRQWFENIHGGLHLRLRVPRVARDGEDNFEGEDFEGKKHSVKF